MIMKYKMGFKLDWLEMIFIILSVFIAGMIAAGDLNNKFLYTGLMILSSGGILLKKRVKIPGRDSGNGRHKGGKY